MTDPVNLIDRQTQLANYLVQGFPNLAIPGIAARSAQASVGNATRENQDKSVTVGALDHGSNGLFQWRDSGTGQAARLSNMQAFGVKWFGAWQSIEAQAAFYLYELKGWYKSLWNDLVAGTKSLETLTANICDQYEHPSAAGRVLDIRIGFAQEFAKVWTPPSTVLSPAVPASVPLPPVAAAPAPTTAPTPTPTPAPLGVTLMDPALIAALAPIVESLAAGLFRALITQLSAQTSGATPAAGATLTPAPSLDLGSLVTTLVPLLTSQLSTSLPGLIAAEVAKLVPPAPAVKS